MAGNFSTSVGTSSTLLLAANGSRASATICNDSAQLVYLNFGTSAIIGRGIRLNPGGDFIETTTVLDIYAIAVATGSQVCGSWA